MAEVVPGPAVGPEESARGGETNGEARKAEQKTEAERRAEESRQREAEQRRTRVLRKEKREAGETFRETAEAVEALKKAAEGKRIEPPRAKVPEQAQEIEATQPKIVSSYPHLENIADPDKVNEILEKGGIAERVPKEEWKKWDRIKRENWLEKNQIVNVVELPLEEPKPAVQEPQTVYEDKTKGILVSQAEDGKTYIVGVADLEQKTIEGLLEKAKVEKKLEFLKDWSKKSFNEKRQWYRTQGIEILPSMGGGGVRWPTNSPDMKGNRDISEIEVRARLEELDRQQPSVPANDPDRVELREHLMNLTDINTILQDLLNEAARSGNVLIHPQMARLQYLINFVGRSGATNRNFMFVNEFDRAVKELEASATATGQLAALHSLLPAGTIDTIHTTRDAINSHFEDLYKNMDPKVRDQLFQRLKEEAQSYARSLQSGLFGSLRDIEERLAPTIHAESRRELPGQEGIIEWRGVVELEGIRRNQLEDLFKRAPNDWREAERHLNTILRFVESTDFSPEQIQTALQQTIAIPEGIALSGLTGQELEDAKAMQDRLNRIIKATQAVHTFRVTAERSSLNPEAVGRAFEGFDDETFRIYFSRFAKDAYGNAFKDAAGNDFNLLDKSMQEIFKRLKQERIDMNLVEELTRYSIENEITMNSGEFEEIWSRWGRYKNPGDPQYQIERQRVHDRLEELRQEMVRRMTVRGWNLSDWRSRSEQEFNRKMSVINAWHKETNLLGVTKGKVEGQAAERFIDRRRAELRQALEQTLRSPAFGLSVDQIREYTDMGILDQALNNAYYLSWTLAFSEYDTIKVWRHELKDAFGNQGVWGNVVRSGDSSNWFGFHIDHLPEFYLQESRGRPADVNQVLWKHMLGKRRKFVLPQLRFMVRTIVDTNMLDQNVAMSGETGFDPNSDAYQLRAVVYGDQGAGITGKINELLAAHRQETGLDFAQGNEVQARGWTRAAAVAELIMNGDDAVPFERLNWSEMLERLDWSRDFQQEESDVTKYNMIDIYDDRKEGRRYFDPAHLQSYLGQPSTARFMDVNSREKFYSRRNIRIWPWMRMVLPAHREIGRYWRKWFKMPEKMPLAEAEEAVDLSVQSGVLNPIDTYTLKRQMLGMQFGGFHIPGWWWLRGSREAAEATYILGKETGKGYLTSPLGMLFEFFRQLFKYSAGALGGQQA